MISELDSIISDLQGSWDASEDTSTITFTRDNIDQAGFQEIIDQISDLRSFIDGRSLIFKLEEMRDIFQFRLHWEPSNTVTVSTDSDQETDPEDLFSTDDARSALNQIRENRISDFDSLEDCLAGFIENQFVEISVIYRLDTAHIGRAIQSEIDESSTVRFYLQKSTFLGQIDTGDLSEIKNLFVSDGGKELFVIQDLSAPCYGSDLGFFSLTKLSTTQFEDFIHLRSTFRDTISSVGRECVIDDFENVYITPDFFEFKSVNDESFVDSVLSKISGHRLLYSIFSLSDVVRRRSDRWQIRISGKKILEQEIRLEEASSGWEIQVTNSGEVDSEIPVIDEIVDSFDEVFQWAYEVRVTDRISVLRNIITLYTTTIEGLIQNIEEIHESAKSNFKFYTRESVDEFIGMQQEVSNYLLETQREFSELRRNLANSLSRDLFRVFGFLVVTWVGVFLQLEKIATVRDALSVSLVPVVFYLVLSIRAVHGLSQQFSSLEDSRDSYYRMYKRQMNEDLFKEIVNSDEDERISDQFQTDKRIYYALFGLLLLLSVYAVIDLQLIQGPISEIIRSILSETN